MAELNDKQIIRSWQKNANAWIAVIQKEAIESRKLVTNQAVIDAIDAYRPTTALDVGCGEGWLTRAMSEKKMQAFGVDVAPLLIAQARQHGGGRFAVCSYEALAAGSLSGRKFDAVVCNFSLLGKKSVDDLIAAAPTLMTDCGHLFIQTLHPVVASGDLPYASGWRQGSACADLTDPAPWYFRTIAAWIACFVKCGLRLIECREPVHPKTKIPASILFICAKI